MIHLSGSRLVAALAITSFLALSAMAQQNAIEEVVLSFSGVLKTITKRDLTIEPDPDNQMTFVRSRRTRFIEDGKETDGSGMKQGVAVTVDAVMKLSGELEALTVTLIDLDQSPSK